MIAPLVGAAILGAIGKMLPRLARTGMAVVVAAASTIASGMLARASLADPLVYWFGGWRPRAGISLGVCFFVDPFGAGLSTLAGVLVCAALVFADRYFDDVGALLSLETQAGSIVRGLAVVGLAVAVAVGALVQERIPTRLRALANASFGRALRVMRELQSGHVGDYVSWLTLGVACFGVLCAALLR